MDDKQLQALANELAKNLKTPEDLSQFDRLLKKISVEAALNAELTHHLGHEKISPNREPTPVMAIPRKPSPLPTDRWNYVLHVIVMVPSNHNW
ncbi:transposase [Escherichia coli]|nr:transposase [Escherichia coli]GDQ77358.1 transposase [Escherichia coli]